MTQADSDLISRTAGGDADAFRELVERHSSRVHSIAYQLTGDSEDARDLAQETFLNVYQSLDKYDPRRSFQAWLYRLTVNLAIDCRRRKRRDPIYADARLVGSAVDNGPRADHCAETAELQGAIHRLLGRLSIRQRKTLVLRDLQGFDTDEVAAILDCRPATVRVQLFRARRKMAQVLAAEYPDLVAERIAARASPGDAIEPGSVWPCWPGVTCRRAKCAN